MKKYIDEKIRKINRPPLIYSEIELSICFYCILFISITILGGGVLYLSEVMNFKETLYNIHPVIIICIGITLAFLIKKGIHSTKYGAYVALLYCFIIFIEFFILFIVGSSDFLWAIFKTIIVAGYLSWIILYYYEIVCLYPEISTI